MAMLGTVRALGAVLVATTVATGLAGHGVVAQTPAAGVTSGPETPVDTPYWLTIDTANLRTLDDMQSLAAAAVAPELVVPFRPTIDPDTYERAKQTPTVGAAAVPGRDAAGIAAVGGAPDLLADRDGIDQTAACGGCRPPDTHGAVGVTQFVEIVNQRVVVYNRDLTPAGFDVPLSAFFGYTAQPVFDPRVVYDSAWNRWVMSAEAFKEPDTGLQFEFLAVSATSDATGPYYVYRINTVVVNPDDFWDYPQLGIDQDSVLVTANVFNDAGTEFRGARAFAVAKAQLYNGRGITIPLFIGLCGTLAPPIVLDQNPSTYFVCAAPVADAVVKYTMRNSSRPSGTTLTMAPIPVPSYGVPRDAQQPGTFALLDSSDSRFVNASTQVGNSLWQVHAIGFGGIGGVATPRYYEFDTVNNVVRQSDLVFASGSSNDFNASIAADPTNTRVYMTWSSTDPSRVANRSADIRFAGCARSAASDPCAIAANPQPIITSTIAYVPDTRVTSQRWGDYSAVTVDPLDPNSAYLVNEYILTASRWGTHLARIGFTSATSAP